MPAALALLFLYLCVSIRVCLPVSLCLLSGALFRVWILRRLRQIWRLSKVASRVAQPLLAVWFFELHAPCARAEYDRKTRTGKSACATTTCLEQIFSGSC